jgi:hypothetical protein
LQIQTKRLLTFRLEPTNGLGSLLLVVFLKLSRGRILDNRSPAIRIEASVPSGGSVIESSNEEIEGVLIITTRNPIEAIHLIENVAFKARRI